MSFFDFFRKNKTLNIHAERLASVWSRGNFEFKGKISSMGIRTKYDRAFTKKSIKKVWIVHNIDINTDVLLTDCITTIMTQRCPYSKTMVNTYSTPVTINTNSPKFKDMAKSYQGNIAAISELLEDSDPVERAMGKEIRVGTRKFNISKEGLKVPLGARDSYIYVATEQNRGGKFFKTTLAIEGLCFSNEEMDIYRDKMEGLLQSLKLSFEEITDNISQYIMEMGVASYKSREPKFKEVLTSNDNLVGLVSYRTPGLQNSNGILIGLDEKSNLPFNINFFESPKGQISIIIGETGYGKTYVGFSLCAGLLGQDVHCSVIDIKGHEWDRLSNIADTLVLDIGSSSSYYVNTMRLDDLDITTLEEAESFINSSQIATENLLLTMSEMNKSMGQSYSDAKTFISMVVKDYYNKKKVRKDNINSLQNTADMNFDELLEVMVDVSSSDTVKEADMSTLISKIKMKCTQYIKSEGIFGVELTLADVLKKELIIYSFNKNEDTSFSIRDSIRMNMVSYLDVKKQAIRKRSKLHTAAFYEEIQRCVTFDEMLEFIAHVVTGGRSNNVIVFLLLNVLDKLNDSALVSVKSNISTIFAGSLKPGDIDTLVNEFECESIEADLRRFITMSPIVEEDNYVHNPFAVRFNTGVKKGSGTFKVYLPEEEQDNFVTRDIKE